MRQQTAMRGLLEVLSRNDSPLGQVSIALVSAQHLMNAVPFVVGWVFEIGKVVFVDEVAQAQERALAYRDKFHRARLRITTQRAKKLFVLVAESGAMELVSIRKGDRKSTRLNSSHLGISYAV